MRRTGRLSNLLFAFLAAPGLAAPGLAAPALTIPPGPGPRAAEPLEAYQWALHNLADPTLPEYRTIRSVAVDDERSLPLPLVAGEDIGIDRAPPESMDPSRRVIVAVLDTGIDAEHPDLANRVLRKPGECKALDDYLACLRALKDGESAKDCNAKYAGVDTDGNGYPLDCMGWNATGDKNPVPGVQGDPNTGDDLGHGTHVAGIIAAEANGQGTRGIAQNVAILPVRVITSAPLAPVRPQTERSGRPLGGSPASSPGAFVDTIARGMLYAIRSGAQVINLSMAWPLRADTPLMRKMAKLAQDNGIIVVSSAGNDSTDAPVAPCSYPGVICVASHGPDGAISHFSNYGSSVDIAAPGLRILSAWPDLSRLKDDNYSPTFTAQDGYELKNGTSMAAPQVTGIVARLLNAGVPPAEVYPRLILGARPHLAEAYRHPKMPAKFTRSGNADLARSLAVEPQPLVLPADKEPVRIAWDGVPATLPFRFRLKNFWKDAGPTYLKWSVDGQAAAPGTAAFDDWASGAEQELEGAIALGPDTEGRLELKVEVFVGPRPVRVVRIPIEITVPVGHAYASAHAEAKEWMLEDGARFDFADPAISIHTITPLSDPSHPEYLVIRRDAKLWTLSLLRPTPAGTFKVAATASSDPIPGPFTVSRLDVNQDGVDDYVVVSRISRGPGDPRASVRFAYLADDLRPLPLFWDPAQGQATNVQELDSKTTTLPDRLSWMKMALPAPATGRSRLVPAWINIGDVPPLEAGKPSPWDTKDDIEKRKREPKPYRIYYLAPDGLRTVAPADKDAIPIQLLLQDPARASRGELPVLLGWRHKDSSWTYAVAPLSDTRLGDTVPLALPHERALAGLRDGSQILPLDPGQGFLGEAITGASVRGSLRTTWFAQASGSTIPAPDTTEGPMNPLDRVNAVTGLYSGKGLQATFSQTNTELQFHDLTRDLVASTSLNRFSFLPGALFSRTFVPVTVTAPAEARASGLPERLPAILVPAGLSDLPNAEVYLPAYRGGDVHVARPARLRLEPTDDCDSIANPVPADATTPAQLVFFCRDRILRIPL